VGIITSLTNHWYHIPTFLAFTFMMLTPSKFFKKVDEVILEKPVTEEMPVFTGARVMVHTGDSMEQLVRDEHILNNMKKMVKISKKKHVKQMWKIKLAEFERELRFKRYVQYPGV